MTWQKILGFGEDLIGANREWKVVPEMGQTILPQNTQNTQKPSGIYPRRKSADIAYFAHKKASLKSSQIEPNPFAFAERAAIVEYDGKLSKAEAEQLAAMAQGFATLGEMFDAVEREWTQKLQDLEHSTLDRASEARLRNARGFVSAGWARKAAELGWVEVSLFGVCPTAPWARPDRMGAAFFGPVRFVTAGSIIIANGNRIYRGQFGAGVVPIWELKDVQHGR